MRTDAGGTHRLAERDPGGQRLLLLMEHEENYRVLADWLGQEYELVDAAPDDIPDATFDLCIVDRAGIGEHGDALAERRAAEEPVMLPVLFVVPNRELERMDAQGWQRLEALVSDRADEIITTPIEKAELRRRIENLLHQRRLSLQLRDQREQYRQLLSLAPVTIAAVVDGDIALINQRGVGLFGAEDPAALVGDSLLGYVHEDDREEVAEMLDHAVADRESSTYIDCRIVVDDEERYVEIAGVPVTDAGETAVQVVLRDVTARREHEQEVERQRDHLARLNRLNEVIREIDRALVRADTRDEIEDTVCERLVDAGGLRLAWVGRVTASSDAIETRAAAGEALAYAEAITPSTDEEVTGGDGPASEAVGTKEVQVVDDIFDHPAFEPWYERAREEEIASCIVVPLLYEQTLYGILAVYAAEASAFDEEERAVFEELGETIAHAMNAAESRRALVADRIYELDFAIRDDEHFLSTVTAENDVTFELEGLVSSSDTYAKYLLAQTAEPERVLEHAEDAPDVAHVRLVTVSDGEALFEFSFEHDLVTQTFGALGATVKSMTVVDGLFDITSEVPYATDVASFVAAVEAKHDEVSLLAQRETERPLQTRQEAWQTFEESLTDRQWAALQTAYYAGFFDWPRGSTGEEVASSLGIAPSTFHEHLRSAQRKLLSVLFDS